MFIRRTVYTAVQSTLEFVISGHFFSFQSSYSNKRQLQISLQLRAARGRVSQRLLTTTRDEEAVLAVLGRRDSLAFASCAVCGADRFDLRPSAERETGCDTERERGRANAGEGERE